MDPVRNSSQLLKIRFAETLNIEYPSSIPEEILKKIIELASKETSLWRPLVCTNKYFNSFSRWVLNRCNRIFLEQPYLESRNLPEEIPNPSKRLKTKTTILQITNDHAKNFEVFKQLLNVIAELYKPQNEIVANVNLEKGCLLSAYADGQLEIHDQSAELIKIIDLPKTEKKIAAVATTSHFAAVARKQSRKIEIVDLISGAVVTTLKSSKMIVKLAFHQNVLTAYTEDAFSPQYATKLDIFRIERIEPRNSAFDDNWLNRFKAQDSGS